MRTINSAFCIRILHNSLAVHLDHARRVQLAKQPCKRAVGACTHSQSDVQHTYEAIKTPGDEEDVSVVTLKVELREALKTGTYNCTWTAMHLLQSGCCSCKRCSLQSRHPSPSNSTAAHAIAAAMCDRRQRRLKEKARCLKEAAVKALQASNDGNARKLLEASAPNGHGSFMQSKCECTYLFRVLWHPSSRQFMLCMELQVKAKVLESAAASDRRSQINRRLADKLEDVLQAL